MEHYVIPWIITVIKMVIAGVLLLIITGIVDNYMPKSVKERIVKFLTKREKDEE